MKVAIIGSRNPSIKQTEHLLELLKTFPEETIVVSGCAYGIDAQALIESYKIGFKTIGCVPWEDYNKGIQAYCNEVVCLNNSMKDAFDSVHRYHPAPNKLSKIVFKLMARNYLILKDVKMVYAYPKLDNYGGYGGTGQGIRIAEGLGLDYDIFT